MMNIINGGAHADNPIDFQEFMIMPVGASSLAEAVRMGSEVFHTLKGALKKAGHNTNVGDEGGFAPNLPSAEAGLDFVMESIQAAGFKPGTDMVLALDCAATEFFKDGAYQYEGEGKTRDIATQVDYLAELVAQYPILSIEDGMSEDDWEGWKLLTEKIGDRCQLVGDDLFVTNVERLSRGIAAGTAQLDPGQGQPDRLPHRDARGRRYGPARRLHRGDVPPLRRDRGLDHRRPRGRDQLRADQDRLAGALRQTGEVQPADPHRGGPRRRRGATPAAARSSNASATRILSDRGCGRNNRCSRPNRRELVTIQTPKPRPIGG